MIFQELAQVLGMFAVCSVPLAFVLTKHQQKMAMILRNQNTADPNEALQRTVQDLAYLAHQQNMAIQSLNDTIERLERQNQANLTDQILGRN
jgi:TolA-binding protein